MNYLKYLSLNKFKHYFLYVLVGALIVSALVAVFVVLSGEFNETTTRSLLTLLLVVMHSLFSLAFIWQDSKRNIFERLRYFSTLLFFIIVASFITSILGIWKIIAGDLVFDLYLSYFIISHSFLHYNLLLHVLKKERYLDIIVYLNILFILTTGFLALMAVHYNNLGEMFFRYFGASGIIYGTLSILGTIFYSLYQRKHEEKNSSLAQAQTSKKRSLPIIIWILLIYLAFRLLQSLFDYLI